MSNNNQPIPRKPDQSTFIKRRMAVVAGTVALAAAGIGIANKVQSISHRDTVENRLSQPFNTVVNEVNSGLVSPSDIAVVENPTPGITVWSEAEKIAAPEAVQGIADTLMDQNNDDNKLSKGTQSILPRADLNMKAVNELNLQNPNGADVVAQNQGNAAG